MNITSAFDSGNIQVVEARDPQQIRLRMVDDAHTEKHQWFHFALHGAAGQACRLLLENAGSAAYVDGWQDYQAVASYDRESWFRVPTRFDDSGLIIEHTPEADLVYYAYFAPYPSERHRDLIAQAQCDDRVQYHCLGQSPDGQSLDLLQIGELEDGKKVCWIIARQHPGETMAQWWMEGCLDTLLDDTNAISLALRQRCVFLLVPNMNPDGSRRGHLRHNALGVDLNRAWRQPSAETSPEVFHVLERMSQTGVDFFLDVHGDEALPYNFIAGSEGIPGWDARQQAQLDGYKQALKAATPEFQTEHGYPVDPPGEANLDIGSNFIGHRFGCLSMTLEMPFKDNADLPNPLVGWSPERAAALAGPCLQALWEGLEQNRI
ncbi:M14 family metallopeptidase [Ferrimonas marina]|uniref:Murein tripeptide amidase MpaA n=1 Tax=Ferrimonas marina TaxID=299255 RepID=A0A1M5RRR1_9GAMM|nr:M14-type cytosolic carboxypeptidase [Ferrimonas marina]SHH28880.1 Murein tripeptide amidase MpaA [Ferrimonas marina]